VSDLLANSLVFDSPHCDICRAVRRFWTRQVSDERSIAAQTARPAPIAGHGTSGHCRKPNLLSYALGVSGPTPNRRHEGIPLWDSWSERCLVSANPLRPARVGHLLGG
jgi:hypothetical protein